MRTSSRPTHRKIRRSTLEIRQEKWKRSARRILATSARQLLSDGDLIIPKQSEAAFVAMDVMPRLEQKRTPASQPRPSATYGPGNWESFFPHLILLGLFLVGAVGVILAISKAVDAFTAH